jgi:carboxypeptidase family protein
MSSISAKLVFLFMPIFALATLALHAQDVTSLSGTVTDSSGKVVTNAKVSLKNLKTGQSSETVTDSGGHFSITNLAFGDYDVSALSEAGSSASQKITLTAGSAPSLNLSLGQQEGNLPNAPSASKTEPSLEDLGFSAAESQSNAKQQALLDKRTHMLKIHQRMGLITTIPLVATLILGTGAGGKSEGTATRDLHVALGAVTGDLYGITAYYAIRAPRIKGTEKRGPIRFHEAMAWIHGPGMILTPILGAMAFSQKNNGEKVHGIASAHGPVAIVTAGAFGAALLSVSVKF